MPATDEQLQDAILQLGDVTSTALAKAADIAQAATDAEKRAHPGRGVLSQHHIQARTDKKVKGQVNKLNVLKTGKYITFPDNLSPVELVFPRKIHHLPRQPVSIIGRRARAGCRPCSRSGQHTPQHAGRGKY